MRSIAIYCYRVTWNVNLDLEQVLLSKATVTVMSLIDSKRWGFPLKVVYRSTVDAGDLKHNLYCWGSNSLSCRPSWVCVCVHRASWAGTWWRAAWRRSPSPMTCHVSASTVCLLTWVQLCCCTAPASGPASNWCCLSTRYGSEPKQG